MLIHRVSLITLYVLVRSVIYQTSYAYKYNQIWVPVNGLTSFVFRVRSCAEAHIALAQYFAIDDVNAYEIIIGAYSNSKCVIRKSVNGTDTLQKDTYHALDCYQFRYFWVGWDKGVIELGIGPFAGQSRVMSWTDPNPHPVGAVSFSSANGHQAQFEFSYMPGNDISNLLFQVLNIYACV